MHPLQYLKGFVLKYPFSVLLDNRSQDAARGFAPQWSPHSSPTHWCVEVGAAKADGGRRKALPCPFLWQQENLVSVCREVGACGECYGREGRFNVIFGVWDDDDGDVTCKLEKLNMQQPRKSKWGSQPAFPWPKSMMSECSTSTVNSPASFTQRSDYHKNI